ncbi:NnrS family protein [Pinisolibacter sp.]|uniref:NnrS family protein n=1 Tax=Pinisolibacter sp. TaxID=2172024 RepID=UPI002FDC9FD7
MATTAEQMRAHRGPAILTGGFRPFFLFGAIWAAIAIILWIPMFEGHFEVPSAFSGLDWHVHELLYGYLPAAVAGFLLTAIPNWTGRLPVVGRPLAGLVALWAAGRVAVLVSGPIGAWSAAAIDASFLLALTGLTAREVWTGKNRRNLRIVGLVALLALGNVVFHVEAILRGTASHGTRIGIAAAVVLVAVIGGRIVPSFTANWLRSRGGRMPVPFARFDAVVIGVSSVALAMWVVLPDHRASGSALVAAGGFQAVRLWRWVGWRTAGEKLVLVLHVAYLFVPVGFLLLGGTILGVVPLLASAALHAWTVGALATMTLAVMTRASLGHTGRMLHATRSIQAIYLGAFVATVARIAMGMGKAEFVLLHVAMVAWLVAFAGFAIVYFPILTRPRG